MEVAVVWRLWQCGGCGSVGMFNIILRKVIVFESKVSSVQ